MFLWLKQQAAVAVPQLAEILNKLDLTGAGKGKLASWETRKILPLAQPALEHHDQFCAVGPGAGSWPPPPAPRQSSALRAGAAGNRPGAAPGYGWALSPQAGSSGAVKYPPVWHLGPPQSSIEHVWSGRGFWHLPGSPGLLVFSVFNAGEMSFFDTKSYLVPPQGGVFSQKTLLLQPLALQFTLSATDSIFLNQNLTMVSFFLPLGKCFRRYTDQ